MNLTLKQRKFADEYIKHANATEAAKKAGYSAKTAHSIATENLQKPAIKNYIAERLKSIESHKIMTAKEAIELLTSIARGEVKETVIVSTPVGVEEAKKEADLKTRISAIKELLKRYPAEDPTIQEQLRKLKAEADIAEAKAKRELSGEQNSSVNVNIVIPEQEDNNGE